MIKHHDLRTLLLDWVRKAGGCVAFTGSARQCLHHASGNVQWITDVDLCDNVRWVCKQASRAAFTRKGVRSGRRLLYAGAIEGGGDSKHLHVHLTIGGCQTASELNTTISALTSRWRYSRWGYHNVDVRELRSCGDQDAWERYVIKDVRLPTIGRFITNVQYHAI